MPIRLCREPKCPNQATGRGYCDEHRKAIERDRSQRRRQQDKLGRSVYRTKIYLQRRQQVISEQPICAICDQRLAIEIDHIVPLHQGGAPYDRENLRGLCRPCHHAKTARENAHRPDAA